MPLAGRAADRYGLPRLFVLALVAFAIGSILSGAAQTLDQLIAARVLQGIGAGAIVRSATAGASLLYEGDARARALGVVGACTFLGMAIGPFAGATVLQIFDFTAGIASSGSAGGLVASLFVPSWRWIFYFGAPLRACSRLMYRLGSGTAAGRRRPERGSLDVLGAGLFTAAIAGALLALSTPRRGTLECRRHAADGLLGPPLYAVIAVVMRQRWRSSGLRAAATRSSTSRRFRNRVVRERRAGQPADRLRPGHRDHRRGRVRGPRALRRPGRAAPGARVAGAVRSPSVRSRRASSLRLVGIVMLSLVGLGLGAGGLLCWPAWCRDSPLRVGGHRGEPCSGSASG